mgnify:CR=1 FL=1
MLGCQLVGVVVGFGVFISAKLFGRKPSGLLISFRISRVLAANVRCAIVSVAVVLFVWLLVLASASCPSFPGERGGTWLSLSVVALSLLSLVMWMVLSLPKTWSPGLLEALGLQVS